VIVETSQNTAALYTVAAQAPDHFVIYLVNTGELPLTVNLEGLPNGVYHHIQTTEVELDEVMDSYEAPSKPISIQVPGMSMHIFTTRNP
jgi:hypothetical protein